MCYLPTSQSNLIIVIGLLQLLSFPNLIWKDIAMDFIILLPSPCGYSNIMVVVDRLSKFSHFIQLKLGFDSKIMVDVFIQNIVKLHGFPKVIVSYPNRVFMSNFCKQLFIAHDTNLAMTSAYNPQSDGQMENLNKTLEIYLRCFVFDHPKD